MQSKILETSSSLWNRKQVEHLPNKNIKPKHAKNFLNFYVQNAKSCNIGDIMLKLLNWLWRQIYFSICWFYELSNSFHNYSVWGMKQGFAMNFWRFPKPSHFTESCANCHIQKNTLKRIKTRLTYNCAHLRTTKYDSWVWKKRMCEKLFFHKVSDVLLSL